MIERQEICEAVEARLIDGTRPAEDQGMAAHVRSCLRCFRIVHELRDVPRIEALLTRQPDPLPDPGEAFWAQLTTRIVAAHVPPATPLAGRLRAWLRYVVPPAVGGAVAATVLVLALLRPEPRPSVPTPPVAGNVVEEPPAPPARAPEIPDEARGALDEALDRLDLDALTQVLAQVQNEATAAGTLEDEDDGGAISPTEEIDLLETDDLRAVARVLESESPI